MKIRPLTQEEIEKIRENPDSFDWFYLCSMRELSEDFIEEFKDQVVWPLISNYQILSETIIDKFQDNVSWYGISCRQRVSKEFYFKFYEKIDWRSLKRDNILYKGYFNTAPRHVKIYILLNHRDFSKYL